MRAFFVILAIAAASADPQTMFYGNHLTSGWPMTYSSYHATPMAWNYNSVPYGFSMLKPVVYKMENSLEKEMKKPIVYSMETPMTHKMEMPVEKVTDNAREKMNTPDYAMKGMYKAENKGAVHIAKREAEPFYYSAMPYTQWPFMYNSHMAYSTPLTYGLPMHKPVVYKMDNSLEMEMKKPIVYSMETPMTYKMEMPVEKVMDNAREKMNTPDYAMKGMYKAENKGAVHIAKREADAQMFYSNAMPVTSYPMTYSGAWNYPHTTPFAYRSAYNWGYMY